jgi:hypothetical protein
VPVPALVLSKFLGDGVGGTQSIDVAACTTVVRHKYHSSPPRALALVRLCSSDSGSVRYYSATAFKATPRTLGVGVSVTLRVNILVQARLTVVNHSSSGVSSSVTRAPRRLHKKTTRRNRRCCRPPEKPATAAALHTLTYSWLDSVAGIGAPPVDCHISREQESIREPRSTVRVSRSIRAPSIAIPRSPLHPDTALAQLALRRDGPGPAAAISPPPAYHAPSRAAEVVGSQRPLPYYNPLVASLDLLSRHSNHAEALLSKLRISPLSSSGTASFPLLDPATSSAGGNCTMISPFASPPPPYSPEHPHIILDHEKLAAAMSDPPPPLPPGEDCPATSPRPRGLRGKDDDIFHLEPTAALTLLARYVELIASMTGDVPPTPPASNPATPGTCTDKENQRNPETGFFFGNPVSHTNIDGVLIKSPLTPPTENLPSSDCTEGEILHGGVDDTMQYSTISRKFWCKSAPEVPIEAYLFRYLPTCFSDFLAVSLHPGLPCDSYKPTKHVESISDV